MGFVIERYILMLIMKLVNHLAVIRSKRIFFSAGIKLSAQN